MDLISWVIEMITLIISLITAVASFLLAVAVIFRRHQHRSNVALALSLLSTAVVIMGDALCVLQPSAFFVWKKIVLISEAVMVPSWLLFAVSFARTEYWSSINKLSKLLVILSPLLILFSLLMPIERLFYSEEFGIDRVLYLDYYGYTFKLILLFYSIMSIVNLEATLKSSTSTDRWKIKETLIGVGGVVAIHIFYFSNALLYRSVNMNLVPVKAGITLVSVMFIVYSLLRHKVMDVEVVVSRKVAYRSLSIFVVGFYLLGIGVLGKGMTYFGPHVGKNITVFLAFGGIIAIVAVIFSEKLRRKIIVHINKNFYSHKYDYREQWLQFTQRISLKHSFDGLLSSIANGFKDVIDSTGAAIWLLETGTNEFVCVKTLDTTAGSYGPNNSLLEFLGNTQWILNVHDPKCKEAVEASADFIKDNKIFLIVPLFHRDKLVGFIILREPLVDIECNYEDYDLLKTFARQAAAAILNARLSEELIEAKEMEAIGRLSSFVMHDLKNASSMLTMLAQNAEAYIDDPLFQKDAIRSIVNTSEKIKGIIMKLKNLPRKSKIVLDFHDLGICVQSAVSEFSVQGKAILSFREIEPVKTKFDREEMRKVVVNLIMNSLDATDHSGKIEVEVGKINNIPFIKVTDNGCGMSREFIEKDLFRPFHTSKKKGLGIGLYQCKTIIEEHSGKIRVISEEGSGTEFIIYLPSYIV